MKPPRSQLPLFASEDTSSAKVEEVHALVTEHARTLAAKLPPWLRFGTSSFTFPGWAGILYAGKPSQKALVARGLGAYASHPLFRTVGLDRSYYAPLAEADLRVYADDLSAHAPTFKCVSKVWDEISTFVFPSHARYGARAGQRNESFLDPARFAEIVAPYQSVFAEYTGPFVVEVSPFPREALASVRAFTEKMDTFLANAPKGLRIAFEVRNADLLVPEYFQVLRKHGAAHVLNFWTAMPPIGKQLSLPGIFTADFVVSRLMLPPFTRYEDRKVAFEPFNRIVTPQHEMRRDTVALVLAARAAGAQEVFVLVNNKAEGSSPLTVFALAELIARALPGV